MTLQLFLQKKIKQSVVSFHLHSHRTSNQPHPLLKLPSSPSVPSLRRKYPNFSSPAILQHALLTQSPHNFSKQSLLHSYQHSHTLSTSRLTGIFPTAFKQARVTPLLKKPTLNTFLIENYRPVSLLPFIAKTLERVVFNQVSLFLSQNNKLDAKQSGFRSGHSTETALLSVTEALQIIRSSCPHFHHWTSLGFHFAGLYPISLVGLSRWPGEGRYPKHINWSLGSVHGPLLFSTYTTSLGPIIQAQGFSYHFYADDTQHYLSFRPDDPTVAARISGCLADISAWMKEHHLQLYLAKTELLVFHATTTLQHDFHPTRFFYNYPISFGQKSWCNLWWPADLQIAHCKVCSILQVCTTQHQKDQALSDRACCTTSCPGPCHF